MDGLAGGQRRELRELPRPEAEWRQGRRRGRAGAPDPQLERAPQRRAGPARLQRQRVPGRGGVLDRQVLEGSVAGRLVDDVDAAMPEIARDREPGRAAVALGVAPLALSFAVALALSLAV